MKQRRRFTFFSYWFPLPLLPSFMASSQHRCVFGLSFSLSLSLIAFDFLDCLFLSLWICNNYSQDLNFCFSFVNWLIGSISKGNFIFFFPVWINKFNWFLVLIFILFVLAAVGNIPYDATEEQLIEICREVGPVVSFRFGFFYIYLFQLSVLSPGFWNSICLMI